MNMKRIVEAVIFAVGAIALATGCDPALFEPEKIDLCKDVSWYMGPGMKSSIRRSNGEILIVGDISLCVKDETIEGWETGKDRCFLIDMETGRYISGAGLFDSGRPNEITNMLYCASSVMGPYGRLYTCEFTNKLETARQRLALRRKEEREKAQGMQYPLTSPSQNDMANVETNAEDRAAEPKEEAKKQ